MSLNVNDQTLKYEFREHFFFVSRASTTSKTTINQKKNSKPTKISKQNMKSLNKYVVPLICILYILSNGYGRQLIIEI